MARFLVIGAAALDRPIWLAGRLRSGVRVQARSLGGRLDGRLGGGGANAGVALRNAGHEVWLAASPSGGSGEDCVLKHLERAGLDLRLCVPRRGGAGQTLIFIEPGGERIVLGLDVTGEPAEIRAPSPAFAVELDGVFVRAAYPHAAAWAAMTRGPVVLHQPMIGAFPGPADLIVASADDLEEAALLDPYGYGRTRLQPEHRDRLRWVVVTHGARGAVAHGAADRIAAPAPAVVARDSTGAGDIFAAGLLEALATGADIGDALRQACAWGAIAVCQEGSAPVDAPAGAFPPFARLGG